MNRPRRLNRALIDEFGRQWDMDSASGYFLPEREVRQLLARATLYVQRGYGEPIERLSQGDAARLLSTLSEAGDGTFGDLGVCLFRRSQDVLLLFEARC